MTHLDRGFDLLRARRHLFEHLLEILGPFTDRELGDLQAGVGYLLDDTAGFVLVRLDSLDFTLQLSADFQQNKLTLKPLNQGFILSGSSPRIILRRFSTISTGLKLGIAVLHPTLSVQLPDVFLTCSNTLGTVDEDHRQYR